jgi:hypothetical protein
VQARGGEQVCFPMQGRVTPSSADDQPKLRAELQRRAVEAIESLKAERQKAVPHSDGQMKTPPR